MGVLTINYTTSVHQELSAFHLLSIMALTVSLTADNSVSKTQFRDFFLETLPLPTLLDVFSGMVSEVEKEVSWRMISETIFEGIERN